MEAVSHRLEAARSSYGKLHNPLETDNEASQSCPGLLCGRDSGVTDTERKPKQLLPEPSTGAGRRRHSCNERCRVAEYRRREAEAARAALLQQSQLCTPWQEHHIEGQLLALLQTILVEHGEEAASAATDAVFQYLWEQNYRTARPSRPATRRRTAVTGKIEPSIREECKEVGHC